MVKFDRKRSSNYLLKGKVSEILLSEENSYHTMHSRLEDAEAHFLELLALDSKYQIYFLLLYDYMSSHTPGVY